jgi:hypothetical protein
MRYISKLLVLYLIVYVNTNAQTPTGFPISTYVKRNTNQVFALDSIAKWNYSLAEDTAQMGLFHPGFINSHLSFATNIIDSLKLNEYIKDFAVLSGGLNIPYTQLAIIEINLSYCPDKEFLAELYNRCDFRALPRVGESLPYHKPYGKIYFCKINKKLFLFYIEYLMSLKLNNVDFIDPFVGIPKINGLPFIEGIRRIAKLYSHECSDEMPSANPFR